MAENLALILRRAGRDGKIVLWGSNRTLSLEAGSLGAELRSRYGDDVVVLGSSFSSGLVSTSVSVPGGMVPRPAIQSMAAAPDNSYEHLFQQAGMAQFLLDLRQISNEHKSILQSPRLLRDSVVPYDVCTPESGFREVRLAAAFDAFIFIDRTSAATVMGQVPIQASNRC
jgi:erythromycin esterase-like protein